MFQCRTGEFRCCKLKSSKLFTESNRNCFRSCGSWLAKLVSDVWLLKHIQPSTQLWKCNQTSKQTFIINPSALPLYMICGRILRLNSNICYVNNLFSGHIRVSLRISWLGKENNALGIRMRVLYWKCQAAKNMWILQVILLRPNNKYSIITKIFLFGKCNIVFSESHF
jgi:hypothetical protein